MNRKPVYRYKTRRVAAIVGNSTCQLSFNLPCDNLYRYSQRISNPSKQHFRALCYNYQYPHEVCVSLQYYYISTRGVSRNFIWLHLEEL
jgi:hypothetical protein